MKPKKLDKFHLFALIDQSDSHRLMYEPINIDIALLLSVCAEKTDEIFLALLKNQQIQQMLQQSDRSSILALVKAASINCSGYVIDAMLQIPVIINHIYGDWLVKLPEIKGQAATQTFTPAAERYAQKEHDCRDLERYNLRPKL